MSTPGASQRSQWAGSSGQPTAMMPPVHDAPPAPAATTTANRRPPPPSPVSKPRRARLVLARVDPWSVMKLSFLLAIGLAIVTLVAVTVLWNVLNSMGVFDSVDSTVSSITRSSDNAQGVDVLSYVGYHRVITIAALLAGINVVLMTALGTLAAFLYNLASSLVGGLHVTLTEDV